MKRFDYHTHNHISFDSKETLIGHCEAALQKGLHEFAVTNHYELDMVESGKEKGPDLALEEIELQEARERYAGKLTILRGIEIGQPDYDSAAAKKLIGAREYDIVLGSLHNGLHGLDFYYMNPDEYTNAQLCELWEAYLVLLAKIARTADIDVLTHILYPVRYVPLERSACFSMELAHFEPIFKALIERGIALELNTAAIRKGVMTVPDPGLKLLKFYRALGGQYISIGSDAHVACDLGANFDDACELAKAAGFTHLTTFRKRQKIMEALK